MNTLAITWPSLGTSFLHTGHILFIFELTGKQNGQPFISIMLSGFPGYKIDFTRLLSTRSEPHRGHFVVFPVRGGFVVEARFIASLRKRPYRSVIKRRTRRTTTTVPVAISIKISMSTLLIQVLCINQFVETPYRASLRYHDNIILPFEVL